MWHHYPYEDLGGSCSWIFVWFPIGSAVVFSQILPITAEETQWIKQYLFFAANFFRLGKRSKPFWTINRISKLLNNLSWISWFIWIWELWSRHLINLPFQGQKVRRGIQRVHERGRWSMESWTYSQIAVVERPQNINIVSAPQTTLVNLLRRTKSHVKLCLLSGDWFTKRSKVWK